ncbi:DUF3885 domain-containing protein [Deinococcus lacus]|uniref:DUF3885 domain-containing protein n=1 Tax=Deinococcus lacus TaxID=392561 RepID=A0ABW1YCW0_9DEIO
MTPLFSALDTTFGPHAFAHALFYAHAPALRFELAGGDTRPAQFLQAIDRARTVLAAAFAGAAEVTAVLEVWGDESPALLWATAQADLAKLGLEPPAPEHRAHHAEGDDLPRNWFAFRLPVAQIPELLWGIFAADLGITPALSARLTLAAPELGVLACPYDSRGMDIIGPNAARLSQLYKGFDGWLLDYDRARMGEMFAQTEFGL